MELRIIFCILGTSLCIQCGKQAEGRLLGVRETTVMDSSGRMKRGEHTGFSEGSDVGNWGSQS